MASFQTDVTAPATLTAQATHDRSVIAAGILLGMGGAGFLDGIVLHQVLQWHHMLTAVRPLTNLANVEINTLWDGLFHLGALSFSFAGCVLLWRASQRSALPRSPRAFLGAMLLGAGSFNLIEGIVDHHILQIHHVKSGLHQPLWDLAFLALGALFAILGAVLLTSRSALPPE